MNRFNLDLLPGKKTYIMGVVAIVWGITGWALDFLDPPTAREAVWAGLTAIALRLGIAKSNGSDDNSK